jgi:NADH:ubiquinone oxidoreductase subunit 6 (subunit J)
MAVSAAFFYLFSAVAIASAVMVIASRNPVHSVLFLILTFFNASGLFILLGAEFLAMILVVVYVGAVAVLFLFVVMMLDIDFSELRAGILNYAPVGMVIGLILFTELALVLGVWNFAPEAAQAVAAPAPSSRNASDQHRGAGATAVHPLLLLFPDGRAGAAGRHDRCHRADTAPQGRRQAPEHLRAECAYACNGCGSAQGQAGAGDLIMLTIGLGHYLTVAAILFTIGIFGIFLNRKNVIIILMSIELMLLSVNINLVAFSSFLGDMVGAGLRASGPHGGSRRGGHRARHPGHLLPQSRHHRR